MCVEFIEDVEQGKKKKRGLFMFLFRTHVLPFGIPRDGTEWQGGGGVSLCRVNMSIVIYFR